MIRDHVPYIKKTINSSELTGDQIKYLMKINNKLIDLEKTIKTEADKIHNHMKKKLKVKTEKINDYNLDYKIFYIIKEDDPDYLEDDDNILLEMSETISYEILQFYIKEKFGIASGYNHNEYKFWDDHSLKNQFHCWLFHSLYDHTDLGWLNILRIGNIWLDINLTIQFIKKI